MHIARQYFHLCWINFFLLDVPPHHNSESLVRYLVNDFGGESNVRFCLVIMETIERGSINARVFAWTKKPQRLYLYDSHRFANVGTFGSLSVAGSKALISAEMAFHVAVKCAEQHQYNVCCYGMDPGVHIFNNQNITKPYIESCLDGSYHSISWDNLKHETKYALFRIRVECKQDAENDNKKEALVA